jgi:hypothetical protein
MAGEAGNGWPSTVWVRAVPGTWIRWPHFRHSSFFPASLSSTECAVWHDGQAKRMAMSNPFRVAEPKDAKAAF